MVWCLREERIEGHGQGVECGCGVAAGSGVDVLNAPGSRRAELVSVSGSWEEGQASRARAAGDVGGSDGLRAGDGPGEPVVWIQAYRANVPVGRPGGDEPECLPGDEDPRAAAPASGPAGIAAVRSQKANGLSAKT